jgi:hypothetical protein
MQLNHENINLATQIFGAKNREYYTSQLKIGLRILNS